MPLDNSQLEGLKEKNEKLFQERKIARIRNGQLSRDLNLMCSELNQYKRAGKARVLKTNMIQPVKFPSLILDKSVTKASRIHLTSKNVIVAVQKEKNSKSYGIEFSDYDDLTFKYIPLHNGIIRDIACCPNDEMILATVSVDTTMKQISLRSSQETMKCKLPVPLFCCEWISQNSVAVGGTLGHFFVVDGKGSIVFQEKIAGGPPVTSIVKISEYELFVSLPNVSHIFDIRAGVLVPDKYEGFNFTRTSSSQKFIGLRRDSNNIVVQTGRFVDSIPDFDEKIQLPTSNKIARPGISDVSTGYYVAIPDVHNERLSLRYSLNMGEDMWEKYEKMFIDANQDSMIDTQILKLTDQDFILATLTENNIRLYSLPIS